MAIEDIVINFHGGTAASVSGKTINNFQGISSGEFSSDLSGYDTGGATGVSISAAKALTAFANGRFQGVDTLTQEVNQESSFVDDSVAPSDNIYTATFPTGVTSVDVEIFLCVGSSNQNDLDGAANAETFTAFDSTNNTTGTTVQLTGVVPDGSDQIIINIDNQHATNDFTAHNGIRFHNIVQDVSVTGTIVETLDDFTSAASGSVGGDVTGTLSETLEDFTSTASGTVSGMNVTGTLSETLDDVTMVASGIGGIGFVNDTFDGTGSLASHWLDYDDSAGGVTSLGRTNNYLQGTVSDNSSNRTRWFDTEQGRFTYQTVKVPSVGIDEYILSGAGVGPATGDPLDDLPFLTNQFSFCGLMVHDDTLTDEDYMFSVIGHRGSSDSSTIEIKGTTAGVSDVTDEGGDVLGTGVTHGDLRVEVDSAGIAKFSYRSLGTTPWTYINVGNTGLVPSSFSLGASGTNFKIGIIGYASDTIGVPFKFTADSMELSAPPNGTIDSTLEDVVSAASGAVKINGSLSETLDNATSTASGLVLTPITGSLSETLDNVTMNASGSGGLILPPVAKGQTVSGALGSGVIVKGSL